ncbi:protein SlyX [Devosia pacifica]|uniref:Protein SlyX homolog n=1 Tax=Devosia pacifica TaxID=1335967 RepID=A0A918RYF3_9HYPH|nr:SlyX family protein [Devosia pacifica]GHA15919.1 protein SlyX [Devosia pacifica]
MSGDIEARLEGLEVRVAYQEQTIDDLNKALSEQWRTIDALKRKLSQLEEEVAEAEISARAEGAVERPPPHY